MTLGTSGVGGGAADPAADGSGTTTDVAPDHAHEDRGAGRPLPGRQAPLVLALAAAAVLGFLATPLADLLREAAAVLAGAR